MRPTEKQKQFSNESKKQRYRITKNYPLINTEMCAYPAPANKRIATLFLFSLSPLHPSIGFHTLVDSARNGIATYARIT